MGAGTVLEFNDQHTLIHFDDRGRKKFVSHLVVLTPLTSTTGRLPLNQAESLAIDGLISFSSYPLHGKLGVRAGNTGAIVMQDVRVPVANRLGEEGEGFKIAMSAIDSGRFTVAAGATGLIQAGLEASLRYAKERHTFGVPIAEHQLVKRMISHMVRKLDTSRLLVYRAGWMKNAGLRNTRETTLAKWHATVSSFEVADDAIQVHGAYGYSDEYPVERYLRNSRGAIIYEGTRELQELLQADFALGYRENKPLRMEMPGYDEEAWG